MNVSSERNPDTAGIAPSMKSTSLTTARASSATMANWYMQNTSWCWRSRDCPGSPGRPPLAFNRFRPGMVSRGNDLHCYICATIPGWPRMAGSLTSGCLVEAGAQLVEQGADGAEVLLDAGDVGLGRAVGHLVVDLDLVDDGLGELGLGVGHEDGAERRAAGAGPLDHHREAGGLEPAAQDLGVEAGELARAPRDRWRRRSSPSSSPRARAVRRPVRPGSRCSNGSRPCTRRRRPDTTRRRTAHGERYSSAGPGPL